MLVTNENKLNFETIPSDVIYWIGLFYLNENEYNWKKSDKYRLPMNNGYGSIGVIMYKQFVITFGGGINGDDISRLDLSAKDKSWEKCIIQCPVIKNPRAVLTTDNVIHLFGSGKHFSMPLSIILPNLVPDNAQF